MTSRVTKILTGLVGVLMVSVFVLGLAHSIATGFAGFEGGLPFIVISVFVLLMVVYDYFDECVRKKE